MKKDNWTWYVEDGKVKGDPTGMMGYKYYSTAEMHLKIIKGENK